MKRTTTWCSALGAALAIAAGAIALPQVAGSADPWDDTLAAKPTVLSRPQAPGDVPANHWAEATDVAPVVEGGRRIFDNSIRTVWLTPSTKDGLCMVLEVRSRHLETMAGCFFADGLAKPSPFVFRTQYSLTVGLVTADGRAQAEAEARGGTVAAPNLVLLETVDSDQPLPEADIITLTARYH